jgi:hypothetical protein
MMNRPPSRPPQRSKLQCSGLPTGPGSREWGSNSRVSSVKGRPFAAGMDDRKSTRSSSTTPAPHRSNAGIRADVGIDHETWPASDPRSCCTNVLRSKLRANEGGRRHGPQILRRHPRLDPTPVRPQLHRGRKQSFLGGLGRYPLYTMRIRVTLLHCRQARSRNSISFFF